MNMQDNKVENIFKELAGRFDTEEPISNHQQRFLKKLQSNTARGELTKKNAFWWKPLSIAASIIVLFAVGINLFNTTVSIEEQVAEISPEAANTQFYFTSLVAEQIRQLESENSP